MGPRLKHGREALNELRDCRFLESLIKMVLKASEMNRIMTQQLDGHVLAALLTLGIECWSDGGAGPWAKNLKPRVLLLP